MSRSTDTHPDFEREPSEQSKLEAVADTYAAVQRLADECARVLAQPEWTRESLLAFVEQSKQRLNVVALAVPFIGKKGA